jgi:site-specific DNA recombinase
MTLRNGNDNTPLRPIRCAIYTRKSSEEGLEMEFNSLDAQREACEAYIRSQRQEGWFALPDRYDDGGFSGGTMERPALKRLLQAIERRNVDVVVIYKIDRLTRSLLDFTRIVEQFDAHQVTFVSITQQFSSTTSMGRLTLNMLLSFAQFEREITGERIRDKVAAAKKKGKYMGGLPVLGYDVDREKKKLIVNEAEAEQVRWVFKRFLELGSSTLLVRELRASACRTKVWTTKKGEVRGGERWDKSHIYRLLNNPLYIGEVSHKGTRYPGEHEAIVDRALWDRVQAFLETNAHVRGNKTRHESPAMLKGLLRCGCCDSAMAPTFTNRRGRIYRYYHCVKASKTGREECDTGYLAAGVIEDAVLEQLRVVFASPEIISRTWRETAGQKVEMLARLEGELRKAQKEHSEANQRAGQLLATRQSGGLSKTLANELEEANHALVGLEERIERLTQEVQALRNASLSERDASEALANIEPVWEHLFPQEKTRLVELLVEGATVHQGGIEVRLRAGGLHTLVSELR